MIARALTSVPARRFMNAPRIERVQILIINVSWSYQSLLWRSPRRWSLSFDSLRYPIASLTRRHTDLIIITKLKKKKM
jgi:hypothetical protein